MRVLRLVLTLLILAGANVSFATTVVIVQTKDGFWIGADGLRSSTLPGSKPESVCKLHEVHGWLLIKSGASEGLKLDGSHYSVDENVKQLTEADTSIEQLKLDISKHLEGQVSDEVFWYIFQSAPRARGTPEKPSDWYRFDAPIDDSFSSHFSRTIALIGYQSNIL